MLEKIQKYETELWTVLCVLFFNIIAHGYRFVNLMFNGDSLLIYQTDQNWKLRGDLVAPMLIATLAVFYFTAALVLIVRMFKLQNKLHIALLCALLAVNITTTSTFATDFHEGDTYMLALLCATVGVALFRKAHPVLGGVFICLCLGFYQAYLQLAIGLLILLFMQDLLKGKDPAKVFLSGLKSIAMLLGGSIAYTLIMRVLLHVKGIVLADHYNGLTNVGDYSNTSIPRLVVDTTDFPFPLCWPCQYGTSAAGCRHAPLDSCHQNQTEQHPVAAACAVFSVSLWHQCRLLYLQRHGTYPDDLLLWSALSAGGAVSAGAPPQQDTKVPALCRLCRYGTWHLV